MKGKLIPVILLLFLPSLEAQEFKSVEEAKGLPVGVTAPDFTAVDANGEEYSLKEDLKNGPVVLIFYRGYWCPYCNKHLTQVQDSLQLIYAKGARVVAVSPENPKYLKKMEEIAGAQFSLLYDEHYTIAEAYDVSFKPKAKQLFSYNTFMNANLKVSHSDDSQRLPIPATYLISQEGIIVWRQFNPDYKNRSSVKNILESIDANQ